LAMQRAIEAEFVEPGIIRHNHNDIRLGSLSKGD
jgi:hypothetical protein